MQTQRRKMPVYYELPKTRLRRNSDLTALVACEGAYVLLSKRALV
jgi:hypothetical protein